ncbi:TerD family protein [Clostridium perfringens]
MGFFDKIFGSKSETNNTVSSVNNANQKPNVDKVVNANKQPVLNLKKNDVLDLSKTGSDLENINFAAGWDVPSVGRAFDLDLCAFLRDKNGKLINGSKSVVYYGSTRGTGLFLNGDNLTGEGDGDDEIISVKLSKIPAECSKITFAVVIYSARSRRQYFGAVKNAYVRLVDKDDRDRELCRYSLTEDGGENTAIIFAELNRENGGWAFKAIGEYLDATIDDLAKSFR